MGSRNSLPASLTVKATGSEQAWSELIDEAQEFFKQAGEDKLKADSAERVGFFEESKTAMERSDRALQWGIATSLLALNYK